MTISRSCPTCSFGTCCKSPIDHSQVFLFLNLPKNVPPSYIYSLLSYFGLGPSQKQQGITGGIALELDRGYEILVKLFNLFKS